MAVVSNRLLRAHGPRMPEHGDHASALVRTVDDPRAVHVSEESAMRRSATLSRSRASCGPGCLYPELQRCIPSVRISSEGGRASGPPPHADSKAAILSWFPPNASGCSGAPPFRSRSAGARSRRQPAQSRTLRRQPRVGSGTAEGAIRIWSLSDGRLVETAEPNLGPVRTLHYTGRGLLVNGNPDPLLVPRR
jgi:hypothetical protein